MEPRTVVITGANTGIGLETAVSLAAVGDRVIIACRNADKAATAVAEISLRADSTLVEAVALDLAGFESIRACAAELKKRCDAIDVLINNAGLVLSNRSTTTEGFETVFGVNHLGHFLLTDLLANLVKAAPAPRVINLASAAHWFAVGGLNFDDLQSIRHYNIWVTYGRSKLANIYFTQELAKRWKADGVAVSAVHPGMVRSEFGQDGDTAGITDSLLGLSRGFTISSVEGADTSVWLATAGTGGDLERSGRYWTKRKEGIMAPWAKRPVDAARLWAASEELIGTVG